MLLAQNKEVVEYEIPPWGSFQWQVLPPLREAPPTPCVYPQTEAAACRGTVDAVEALRRARDLSSGQGRLCPMEEDGDDGTAAVSVKH